MTQRRDFLRQASLLAAGSLAARRLEAEVPADTQATQSAWDMSWTQKMTGKYKMVFDAPEISGGTCLHQVRVFYSGYAAVHGTKDADCTAVLVIRHAAVPMVLNDEVWEDGYFGKNGKLKDPETGKVAKRNPFINVKPGSPHALTWPDGALDTLISRGTIVLACHLALSNVVGQVAQRRKMERAEAQKWVFDRIIPGVTRMPSGVFATCKAQELGCGLLQSA